MMPRLSTEDRVELDNVLARLDFLDADQRAEVVAEVETWCAGQVAPWFDRTRYLVLAALGRWGGDDEDVNGQVIAAAAAIRIGQWPTPRTREDEHGG